MLPLVGLNRAKHPGYWRNTVTTQETATEAASRFGREANESVEEMERSAGRRMDEARSETGAALHTAACSVRGAGLESSEAIADLAAGAAEELDATASYVENHDLRDVVTSLRMLVHRHLTGSLLAAAAIGFLAAGALHQAAHSTVAAKHN